MGIVDKINLLKSLEDEYKAKRSQVIEAIVETIKSIGQNPAITPISSNCYTIKVSALIDAPWSPAFHNWELQAELLIDLLQKKPVEKWAPLLSEWSDKKNGPSTTAIVVDKVQLNKQFLSEVVCRF